MLTFPGVLEKVEYISEEIARQFNGLNEKIDWDLLGRALGEGINLALALVIPFITTFEWDKMGASLSTCFNGLVDRVRWYEFGQLLWAGFKIGLETLAGFITNLEPEKLANAFNSMVEGWHASILETINEKIEWDKIGSNLAEVLNNIEWDKAISGAFDVIIGALNGGKKLVDGFVQRFNWKKTADSIKNGLNNGIHNIPWAGIGQTLGSLFSTALMFLSRVTSGIPFEEIGSGIATALNSAMEVVPWRELGSWLSTLFQGALKGLNTGIKTFDWNGLGRNVAEAINGVDWYELLKSLADTLLNAIDGALDLLIGLLEGLEWYKIAKEMASGLIEAIGKHDWGATVSKLYEALGAAVRAAGEIVLGVTDAIAEAIANGLLDSIGFFQNEIEEAGGNVWVGIQNGCKKAMLGIVEWIATHIIDPFLKGLGLTEGGYFRTRIEQAGGDIIAGLLQGIMDALGPIGELLERALKGTGDFWDDVFHITSTKTDDTRKAVETNMQGAGRSVKSEMDAAESTVAKVWGGITRTTNVKASAVRSTTAKEWSGTRTETEKTWSLIHSGLSTTWQNVQTTSATGAERTKTTVTDTWHNTQTDTETTWGAISQGLGSVWGEIGKTAGSKFHETQEAISTEWNNAQASTDTVWGDISQGLTTAWEGLNSTATDKFTQIKDKITGAWRDSQRETDQKMDAIAIKVGAQAGFALKSVQDNFSKVSSAITTPLNSAKATVQGLGWYGLGSNIVEGISAGVRAKAAALANSVANAAYNSLQAAKNVLGINSPSRLFRDIIGLGIVEGTAVGVEENQRMVDNSINSMADGVIGTFSDVLDIVDIWKTLRAVTAETWKMIELDLTTVWQRISQAAAMSFATLYKLVLSSFSSMGESISFAVDGVVENVRRMSDGIMQSVSQAVAGFYTLTNAAADAARMMSFIGSSLPTPRLAGGGVIPQSREFLSVVSAEGGQSGVTEDAIRRIVREEAGGDNTGLLQAILDAVRAGHIIMVDRHVLGKTVTQEQNRMTRASGRSALLT
jgi:hypothetical protein